MARRLDHRRISKHRNYTVEEAARRLSVSRVTVRRWIAGGLPALDDQRPMLILGGDLIAFLAARRKPRQRCRLDECYCFACRAPRVVAGGMAELRWLTPVSGNLRALCATCTTVMHKRIAAQRLPELCAILDVTIVQGREPLSEGACFCSNDHFATEHRDHA